MGREGRTVEDGTGEDLRVPARSAADLLDNEAALVALADALVRCALRT